MKTASLFSLNITGVITWIAEAQTILGAIGALLAVISGIMLVAINWDRFEQSKAGRWLIAKFSRNSTEG